MNKKFALLTFLTVFLLSAVIGSQLIVDVAARINRIPGVIPGDWAEYAFAYSASPNVDLPPPEQMVDWVKITVREVIGTNITFQTITRFANQREETEILVVDVETGQSSATATGSGTGVFIAKDLNRGDLIYTDPPPWGLFGISLQGATINETITQVYPTGSATVNHLNLTKTQTFPEGTLTNSTNIFWFRETGMPAELSIYMLGQPDVGEAMWWKVEAEIIAIVPEFPPALILPLFIIVTVTAVLLGRTIGLSKKLIRKPSPRA